MLRLYAPEAAAGPKRVGAPHALDPGRPPAHTAPMLRGLMQGVLSLRIGVLVLVAAVSGAAAWSASQVRFDSDVEIWFLEDDPELVVYHRFLETFRTDEIVVVGLFADDVFTPEVLDGVDALTEAFARVPQVHRVRSLTNASRFESREDVLAVVPVVPSLPVTASVAASVRAVATEDPLLADVLVAPDGGATAIVVELSTEADTFEEKVALVRALTEAAQAGLPPGAELRMAGTPVVNEAVFRYSQRDFGLLGGLSLVLMLLICFGVFRQVWAAVLPLTVVLLAVLWTFGLMGALGFDVNLVSQSLAVVLFAVGIADAIHVMTEYQHALVNRREPKEALVEALTSVAVPCLFTTVTTAAGMLSLLSSHLRPVREFGALAAAGVGVALLLSFTFLPAVLSFVPAPSHASLARHDDGLLARMLHRVALLGRTRRRSILLGFGLAVAVSAYLAPQLQVGANPAAYFLEDDPVREDLRRVDEALGGSTSIELLVTSEDEGLLDPARVARLEALERWLEGLPAVAKVGSITDGLRALERALTGQDRLPSTRPELSQAYLLIEDEPDFAALVTEDYATARISARVRMSEAAALVERIPEIEAKLAEEFSGPELRVRPTGFVKLISEMELYIVDSQVRSFGIAFALISVLMIVLLRSVRLGLFAMIPNLGPVVVGLGVMKLLGIRLDPGTAMLGSLTLGLVVDDTVHMVSRIKAHLSRGLTTEAAVTSAITEVGRALTTTSLVLAAGFGVLAFGSFTPNIYLGVMAAVVIGLALAADLLVLPAALTNRRHTMNDSRIR